MSEENSVFLMGYKNSTRRYLLQISIACVVLSLLLLVLFNQVSAIPLLLTGASLAGELWWNSRKSLKLTDKGLLLGEEEIPWSEIVRYTTWGPLGIPLTPIKIQGVNLYFKEECYCIYSTADGYHDLLKKLESLKFSDPKEPVWYQYPKRVVRVLRYAVAFTLSFLFLLVFALSLLVILAIVVGGYFVFRSLVKSKREGSKTLPEDAWVAGAGSLVLFCVVYYIFQSPYLIFFLGILPLAAIVWFPWQPQPLSIISDALFVGKKEAYPLRHLRTSRIIPKLFILKIWQLSFGNGDVNIFPFLENFENFKKKLENSWDMVQKRYQGKKMSAEEASIGTPSEEARKIYFFQADEISLQMPVAWQVIVPIFFLIHLLLLSSCLWCVYYTPLGKISHLGLFLTHIVPIFLLVYGSYILFSLVPRFFSLYRRYYIDDNGIKIGKKIVPWSDIKSIVPYQTPDKKNNVSLFDGNGRSLLEISQDMNEWELAIQKIHKKIEKIHKYDITESGAVALLARRAYAWQKSWRILVVLAMLIALPFILDSIIVQKQSLAEKATTAVTVPSQYILPDLLGKRILVVPYQDWQGKTWYALASPKDSQVDLSYRDTNILYLPDNPLLVTPYGCIQDPLVSFLNYLETKGFESEHLVWLENLIAHSHYFFWGMACLIFFLALLHQDMFAGILTQRMPAPLGPIVSMHGSFILQNTIRMLVHLSLLLLIGILALYLHFPAWFSEKISVFMYFSEIWIALSILLPVLFCPYLIFCMSQVLPDWLRSFRKWEIQEDGIKDHSKTLKWEEIKSIAVLRFPNRRRRKVAMLYGNQGPGICLEGDLIHFNTILAHIRQETKCKKDDYTRAKYFYRKALSIPKFFRMLTCMLMVVLLFLVFSLAQDQQASLPQKGAKTLCTVHSSLFKKLVLCSYQDEQTNTWFTLAWNQGDVRESEILYNRSNPAFWQPIDNKVISWQEKLASFFPILFSWEERYSPYLYYVIFWASLWALAILTVPLLWYLPGVLWGFPPLIPEPDKK